MTLRMLVLAGALTVTLAPPDTSSADSRVCIAYWGEARYVVGYNHIVHIVNGCDRDATCDVSTDVNPNVQTVAVPRGTHVAVTTFLGAPTSRFVPRVECALAGP